MKTCDRVSQGWGLGMPARSWVVALTVLFLLPGWATRGRGGEAVPGKELLTFDGAPRDISRADGEGAASGNDPAAPGTVLALAVSPDGSTLALAGEIPVVVLRDTATNRNRTSLVAHTEPVLCLAFSPDGTALASGGFDRTVRLWNPGTGAERSALLGHEGWVYALAFSPDGTVLASAGQDGTVRFWDAPEGRELATLQGHHGPVRALAFSPDGGALASAGSDRSVRLWDVAKRAITGVFNGHRGAVRALAFSADGRTLASASEDHAVKLWDVPTGRPRATLSGHTDQILALAFSPGGLGIVTGGYDATVRVWNAADGGAIETHRAHPEGVTALAFQPKTGALVTAGYDRAVKLWSPTRSVGTLRKTLKPPAGPATAAVFSPDGKSLVTLGGEPTARVWDTSDWRERGKLEDHGGTVTAAAFSAGGKVLVTTAAQRTLKVWDARRLTPVATIAAPFQRSPVFAVAPDGASIVTDGRDGSVVLWDLPPPALEERLVAGVVGGTTALRERRNLIDARTDLVQCLAFSPDGSAVAVALLSQTGQRLVVSVRDVADGRERARLAAPGRSGRVIFSPDGKALAGVFNTADPSQDAAVVFWDARSWAETGRIQVRGASPNTLAFTPDGSRVAVGNTLGVVLFRDAATREPRGQIKAHTLPVSSLSFSPDGRTLATADGGSQESVKVWELAFDPRPAGKPAPSPRGTNAEPR